MKSFMGICVTTVLLLSNVPTTRGQECAADPDPETAEMPANDCALFTNVLEACYNLNCYDDRVCMYEH